MKFYFVFAPNNSGTTICCQYLAAQTDSYLPPFGNNEGQMIPEVRDEMRDRPWEIDKEMNWPRIRSSWSSLAQSRGKTSFVEGSPPNLVRIKNIRKHFDPDAVYMCMISSPFLHVASSVYNYKTPTNVNLKNLSKSWLRKASLIQNALDEYSDIKFLNYEQFCTNPIEINRLLNVEFKENFKIRGKRNTSISDIRDASARTISFLTAHEIDEISDALEGSQNLLEYFGYDIVQGDQLLKELYTKDPSGARAGLQRRAEWEVNMGRVR